MARSKKSTKKDAVEVTSEAADSVEDAAVATEALEDTSAETPAPEPELDAPSLDADPETDVAAEDLAETPEVEADELNSDAGDAEPEASAPEDAETPATAPVSAPEPQVIVKKRGFIPLILGGALCAGLGYGGANFLKPDGWPFPGASTEVTNARFAALEAGLASAQEKEAELTAKIASLQSDLASDLDAMTAQISEADISSQLAPLHETVEAMSSRLTAVEAAPVAEAIVSPEATAAYEKQLAEMRALLDSEVARLTAAQAAAETEEANAAKASAAARLQEAIATGMPYSDVLANIDVEIPQALRDNAESGVVSLQVLAEGFSTAADIAIVETAKIPNDEQTLVDKFLRTQLGLRSLTPQDGSSPDAILSRAEQALRDIDLQAALDEVATLPDIGQSVLADWTLQAQARLDVTTALSEMLAQ